MKPVELAAIKCVALALVLAASILFNRPGILPYCQKLARKNVARPKVDVDLVVDDGLFSVDEQTQIHSIKTIHLIGERHCGTKWITKTLRDCFGDQVEVLDRFTRFKHWFQYDSKDSNDARNYHHPNSSLVVAMFRDPFDWIESMRIKPYHSPNHFDLDWKTFVTTPWTMKRGPRDQQLIRNGSQYNASCMHRFAFDEIVPCSQSDRNMYNGTFHGKTVGVNYELNHDGSGQPYESIVDLRRDKIMNFLDVANFHGVASFLPVQYEFVVTQGTSELIDEIQNISGFEARCKRMPPRPLKRKDLENDFVEWIDSNVDWDIEKLIGYLPRRVEV